MVETRRSWKGRMKILFTTPLLHTKASWGHAQEGFIPPIGMISIYNYLRSRGYDVTFLDMQFGDYDPPAFQKYLRQGQYDLVGLSVYTPTADYAFKTAALVRESLPGAKVLMGNVHATVMPERSMRECPELDFIIMYEGEYATEKLVQELMADAPDFSRVPNLAYRQGGEIRINPRMAFIGQLDDLPLGFYGDLDLRRYIPHVSQYSRLPCYPVLTQRGCPFGCIYCSAHMVLGGKLRAFSAARVVDELGILVQKDKARDIYFQDSTFTADRAYAMELMRLLIRAKLDLVWSCNTRADKVDPELLDMMYTAGCRRIVVGIESGNQATLDFVKKRTTVEKQTQGMKWIHQAGIRTMTNFIICLPGETPEMVRNTIRYAISLRADMALFWLPMPYPKTVLYDMCHEAGHIRQEYQWKDLMGTDPRNPVYVNPDFGLKGMQYWYWKAYRDYYTSPVIWWTILKHLHTRDDWRKLRRAFQYLCRVGREKIFPVKRAGVPPVEA
jgi:anaerobic magnesium-protoporphyrin IX monomethyl ester cyclase